MEVDPTRMRELLVGLHDVTVLGIKEHLDSPLIVTVEQAGDEYPIYPA